MKVKFAQKKSALAIAVAAIGLSILATLNYAQQTPQSQVDREVSASIRAGNSLKTIIATEMKAGRDPATVMFSLSVAMSNGRLSATSGEVFAEFAKAAPNQVAQLAAAAVQQFGRSDIDMNTGNRTTELTQKSPTALMNAIVAATPTGQLGSVMSAVFGAAGSLPGQSTGASLTGLVYAATQAIANDSRSGTSPEFTPGAAVATAVGTLKNAEPAVAIRIAQAAVLALPGDTQSVIWSLSKLENTEKGMNSAGIDALKAAVTQTIVSNPSQASTIAGYATTTIVANVQGRNISDMAPLANIVMQGIVDGIIRSPGLSTAVASSGVIAQAIISASSYASAPNLVTSMLSNTAAYLNGAATPANSTTLSGMLQNAAGILASTFPNQSAAITSVSTTVQPIQLMSQIAGTPNAVIGQTDPLVVPLATNTSTNPVPSDTNSSQSISNNTPNSLSTSTPIDVNTLPPTAAGPAQTTPAQQPATPTPAFTGNFGISPPSSSSSTGSGRSVSPS